MKKSVILLSAIAMMATATSCSNEDEAMLQPSDGSVAIIPTYTLTGMSRASNNLQATAINNGAKVGFFANGLETYANVAYTANNDGTFTASGSSMYWPKDKETVVNIYAYAPYAVGVTADDDNSFSVSTDQSVDANYLASDLLLGNWSGKLSAASNGVANLSFNHALAKVNITFNIDDDFAAASSISDATVKILNTVPSCTFTIGEDQGATVDATATAADIKVATGVNLDATTTSSGAYSAIIVPQTVASGQSLFELVCGDIHYKFNISSDQAFDAGKVYSFTATLSPDNTELSLASESDQIEDWGTGTAVGGSVVKEQEARKAQVSDWYLSDGTYAEYNASGEVPANAIGVVYSTTDVPSEYQAKVAALVDLSNAPWVVSGATITDILGSAITTGTAALATDNGLTLTPEFLTANTIYNAPSRLSAAFGDGGVYAVPAGMTSGWFIPSAGEMSEYVAWALGTSTVVADETKITIGDGNGYKIVEDDVQVGTAAALQLGKVTVPTGVNCQSFPDSGNPGYWTATACSAEQQWVVTFKENAASTIAAASNTGNKRLHLILLAK